MRRCIADEIEHLVDMLDTFDGDPDAEPWLAGFEPEPGDDREDESEHDEDDGSDEPDLGWPNPMGERLDALANMAFGYQFGDTNDDRELDEAEGGLEDAGDEPEADRMLPVT